MRQTITILAFIICWSSAIAQLPSHAELRSLIRDGKFDEAEKKLNDVHTSLKANAASADKAALSTTQGVLFMNKGRNDLALDHLQQALNLWEQAGALNTLEAAETQSYLGNLYRATGKFTQAEEQLSIALLTRQKLLPSNDELIAASLNDLGLVYTYSDPDKALTHYELALEIYLNNHGSTDPKIAIAQTNIGYLNYLQEFYGDAVNSFKDALKIWEVNYSSAHPAKGFVLFNLGSTHEKMGDLKAAREFYERALRIYEEAYSGKHPDISRVHNAIGNLEKEANQFDEALRHYQFALKTNHPFFSSEDVSSNPPVSGYYDGNVLLYSMMYKAQGYEQRYFRKSLRFKDLQNAIKTLQSCDSLIDHLRHQITNENDKIALGAIASEVYADGVRISMETAKVAVKKDPYYELAFFFSEKSKAAVLLGAISDANAKSYSGIPPALLEEEKQIKAAMAMCAQKLALKPDASEEQYLRQTYYELGRSYQVFGKKLEQDYPDYFNLKFNSSNPSVRDLKKKLPPGTLALSYFIDDKNERLYTFRISSKEYRIDETALPQRFDRYVTGLKNSLYFSEISTYKEAARELSRVLVPQGIPSNTSDLIIIPSSRLSTIPFEALFTGKITTQDSYRTLPYLAKKYAVRYEFSGGLIIQKSERKPQASPSILLCAPVSFAPALVSDLPGTESEVNDISGIFEAKNYVNRKLLRDEAQKKNLREGNLKQYSYLHFATHGVVDATRPDLSRIFLKHEPGVDDGFLYAGEIYNLELNADLVTLSACETGLGKITKGEGVIGLSRALIYAGARNCMVSFWKVSDESTALLMKTYYARLLDSPAHNLSATLRDAKLAMINHDQYCPPFYWAPFILIGF